MSDAALKTELKTVGRSGQISLGKTFAGKVLRLERRAGGEIVLTPVAVVPESQLWTLEEPHRTAIARGLAWAAANPPADSDLDALAEQALSRPRRLAGGNAG